jgi:hypothetical protein
VTKSVASCALGLYVAIEFMRLDKAFSTRKNWLSIVLSIPLFYEEELKTQKGCSG